MKPLTPPYTVKFDNQSVETVNSIDELKECILNAHSEQSFADSITDANGVDLGVHWSLKIVRIDS